MSGIGLVLNAAKDALLTQQYAIDVVSHNVANVNTEGYSRQIPVLEAKTPASYAGFILGRGVALSEIVRSSDNFIETRLRERQSDLSAMSEKEIYMGVLEGIFNEDSGLSLSSQLSDFWNAWQDLSNNPSGLPERTALYEMGSLLAQSFNDLSGDLDQLEREINLSLEASTEKVNQLSGQIATLNEQIISMEVTGTANDLRDQRNMLLLELSEYIDIRSFEYDDGNITVMTTSGYILVDKAETYDLGINGTEITWEGSGGEIVNITDKIQGGKMAGWLEMRDETIPKYEADLNELAKSIVWEVNKVHSQGVGLEGFTDVTGAYAALDKDEELWTSDSGLTFYDQIVSTETFDIWVYDSAGNAVSTTIDLDDAGVTSLQGLADTLDGLANLNAEVTSDNRLRVYADSGCSFAFANDTSNVLAALGVNTFFNGSNAVGIEMNSLIETNKDFIAAAVVDSTTGDFAAGDNSNALAIADLQYQDVSVKRWTYERGSAATSETVTDTLENYLHSLVGAVGIESQSITRSKEYNQVIVDQLSSTRDSISAVSLDEEMTNLIKFQHAYSAAAKLISTADEMLKTLLDTR